MWDLWDQIIMLGVVVYIFYIIKAQLKDVTGYFDRLEKRNEESDLRQEAIQNLLQNYITSPLTPNEAQGGFDKRLDRIEEAINSLKNK